MVHRIERQEIPRAPREAAIYALSFILENRYEFVQDDFNENGTHALISDNIIDLLWCVKVAEAALEKLNSTRDFALSSVRAAIDDDNGWDLVVAVGKALNAVEATELDSWFDADPEDEIETFHLDRGEIDRVLTLAAEMRMTIARIETLPLPHKARLLKRIAAIEKEIFQPSGTFDVILAGVVEAGDALGKFGKSVKPLVDRMQEIRKLIEPKTNSARMIEKQEEQKKLPPPEDQ